MKFGGAIDTVESNLGGVIGTHKSELGSAADNTKCQLSSVIIAAMSDIAVPSLSETQQFWLTPLSQRSQF